jgi:nucleoporin NDC1
VRTTFIYISALFVFILHVGTLKIGKRQTTSPFDTLRRLLSSPSTIQPFLWYTASAIWFSEVFIWCSANEANLGWIERGGLNTPDKMNERPIYLRAVCLMLAVFQSCLFLYVDLGALKISIGRHRPKSKSAKQDTHPKVPIKQQLRENGVALVIYCAAVSATVAVVGPFIYSITVRQWLWRFHLAFAKLFWNLSRANARATGYPPCNPLLMLRSFGLGFLLLTLWMATSIAFSLFLDREPLKKGIPLSTGSKDPNGTLLNGLKAKRDVVKTFAFWELAAISEKQPERRKAIFADFERPEGSCWASMQETALNVVRQIEVRIDDTKPKLPSPSQHPQTVEKLPSIAPPISEKQIVLNSPGGSTPRKQAEALIAAGAKRIGQSSHPWSPPVEKVKADLYERAQPSIQAASQWRSSLDKTVVGSFFVKTKERKINAVILGAPHSQSVVVVDAISSMTKMLVASLSEDVYGKVNKGVPEVVRTFTKTVNSIEGYVQSLGNGIDKSQIEDVLIVHALLKASLSELLAAFQMYLHDVGLGVSELNSANKAAQNNALIEDPPLSDPQPEMEQPQQRRQLGERQARRGNGQAAGAGGGSRKQAQPALQPKPQQAQQKDKRPAQERLQLQDVEDEEDELEAEMPWSNPRRKLFDTASPPGRNQDWLGNNMYNADTRQRRGFEVDSPA